MSPPSKAVSVTATGDADGWQIVPGFFVQREDSGASRLLVAVPTRFLAAVHRDLVRALGDRTSVLYRQKIERANPRQEGAPPRDFLALDVPVDRVLEALADAHDLFYADARAELWLRGIRGQQIILDCDGLVYVYPDDPLFKDVCRANGLSEGIVPTMSERDYVKHVFDAANDPHEIQFLTMLGLTEMPR